MDVLASIGCQDDRDIRLDVAALELAAADRLTSNFEPEAALLVDLAARLPFAIEGADWRAEALTRLLAEEEGFTGDSENYDAPHNADFLSLLERRRGLPITLAILYVALARRVGWQARVLGLPGHVLVAIGAEETTQSPVTSAGVALIDVFESGRTVPLDLLDAAPLPGSTARPMLRAGDTSLLNNRESLVRLVMNQASRARAAGNHSRALTLYRRLTLIAPAISSLWWEQARLEQLTGDPHAARGSLAAMRETTRDPATMRRIHAAIETLAR